MLHHDRIDALEGIGVNKSNRSEEYMLCHYWYFLDTGYRCEPETCNECRDILTMVYELKDITILNIKGVD